ncbi:glycosyltransferase [Pinirhizobacter soli]|uniref:glycosyltransferase n=1 Tax=Pinirhizobacter soli TaxID=2786953 RepID=UPI002029ED2A|nr:glycosyltransferase [Pinirhizobacter soli]
MQPIMPAVGGGRQRLLGLYHALGEDIQATYIGSYDWPGELFRDQQLSPGLREIIVPLTVAHHEAARAAAESVEGRVVIDCMFSRQAHLSPEYLRVAREYMAHADVVVFSHPWAFPPLEADLKPEQLVVYDSQNVESILRTDLHGELASADDVLRVVVADEYALCRRADLILACSHEDREAFARLFKLDIEKMRVVPNGIFAFSHAVPDFESRCQAKSNLGLPGKPVALFVGSNYAPNNDAARFIANDLAKALPSVHFAIVGGCGAALAGMVVPDNVHVLGQLDELIKQQWLTAADVALNPLTQGSGTSIKMFDFMAAGLPVIATGAGARGIIRTGTRAFATVPLARTGAAVESLVTDDEVRRLMGAAGRKLVEDFYAWERISPRAGRLFQAFLRRKLEGVRTFTVLVPSYERPDHLERLFQCLVNQQERDFDVVVIDQSREPWAGRDRDWGFTLTYVHTPVRGAVKARNAGGELATGRIIAFTDDDCEPTPGWLAAARACFQSSSVIGVEGRVESDHMDTPDWRPVSNVGFAGLGFMTANLFAANAAFQHLNGFDLMFDEPHFREDTDFGWRLQELGEVPYCEDALVFHPAHRRDSERESSETRSRFFEKDAILYKKHPARYMTIFHAEGHWHQTEGFWSNFERGAAKYNVDITPLLERFRDVSFGS